jgi:putative oxidoreductase
MRTAKTIYLASSCLRWCLAITFLSAVADRFGLWGPNGSKYASWGDWSHFVAYSSGLNWFLPASLQSPMAGLATALEATIAVALLVPRWARVAAAGAAILLTLFALAMATANGIKSPLNYSVFVDAAAAFLLYAVLSPA